MDYSRLATLLANATNDPTARDPDTEKFRRDHGYAEFERTVLADMLSLARDFPGCEKECWSVMAEAFKRGNKQLRSKKVPELHIVSFHAFSLKLQESTTEGKR